MSGWRILPRPQVRYDPRLNEVWAPKLNRSCTSLQVVLMGRGTTNSKSWFLISSSMGPGLGNNVFGVWKLHLILHVGASRRTCTCTCTHTHTHTEKWPYPVYPSAFASYLQSINLDMTAKADRACDVKIRPVPHQTAFRVFRAALCRYVK